MKNKSGKGILVAILLLAIGFAAISTTLFINGTLRIGANEADYKVYFSSAKIGEVDQTIKKTVKDADTIEFSTATIKTAGDSVALNYVVKNDSTQYDAKTKIKCYVTEDPLNAFNEYFTITGVYAGNDITFAASEAAATFSPENPAVIEPSQTATGSITMTMVKSFPGTPTTETSYIKVACTIDAQAGERTK